MNLSCTKPVVSAGDTLTITCFTCGMPSSKEWAQKVRSRATNPLKSYYPFLLQIHPPHGAALKEDGSTYVCAFCHASMEAQWKNYERQPSDVPPANRKYNLQKFICGVCGVETYRKRVRTLPFQEFPFLTNQRPAGSLTLGNNPLAVVCLDCSETLWAQSAEYDRWGLPIHKRRFNWLARPPPDPDSLEATVARLPSGETQLPRCPATEPLIKAKESAAAGETLLPSNRLRTNKNDSNSNGSDDVMVVRKNSLTSQANSLDGVGIHSQPPIVTVAPMSSHTASITTLKKETVSLPLNLAAYPKFDSLATCLQPTQLSHPLFPRSPMFPPGSYGPFPWGNRETGLPDPYAYTPVDALQTSAPTPWPWIPTPATNLIHYPNYVPSTYSSRSFNINEPFYNSTHSYYPASPESLVSVATTSTATTYLTSFPVPTATRPLSPQPTTSLPKTSSLINVTLPSSQKSQVSSSRGVSPPTKKLGLEESKMMPAYPNQDSLSKRLPGKVCLLPTLGPDPSIKPVVKKPNGTKEAVGLKDVTFKSTSRSSDTLPPSFKPKSNAIRNHMNEKHSASQNQNKASPERANASSQATPSARKMSEEIVPKKWQWQTHQAKGRVRSVSESERSPAHANDELPLPAAPITTIQNDFNKDSEASSGSDVVMDLSLPTIQKLPDARNITMSSSKKFMIAYLCQSESQTTTESQRYSSLANESVCDSPKLPSPSVDSTYGRRSVIFAAPRLEFGSSNLLDESLPDHEKPPDTPESKSNDSDFGISVIPQSNLMEVIPSNVKQDDNEQTAVIKTLPSPMMEDDSHSEFDEVHADHPSNTNKPQGQEDVCDDDIREFVRKTITEHKVEAKQARQLKRKLEEEQEGFLETLGLITPRKKADLELNILIKRSNFLTLPPLKLRPSTPPKMQLGEEFKNRLLQIAFEDPSLKKCDLNDDEVAFLAQLDLKPASKPEKTRREVRWRIVLTERMMREKRGENLCGTKTIWGDLPLSDLPLKSPSENPNRFDSLYLSLPDCLTELLSSENPKTSDLLQIVENTVTENDASVNVEPADDASSVVEPVITYPKYIPSYASQISPSDVDGVAEPQDAVIKSNVPSTSSISSRVAGANTRFQSLLTKKSEVTETTEVHQKLAEDSVILKVPVIKGAGHSLDKVSSVQNESSPTSIPKESCKKTPNCDSTANIDAIIQSDALNCENFMNQVNNLLNTIPTTNMKPAANLWPQSASEWKKLKTYLKARQNQVKALEDTLKKKEKQVLNQLKTLSSNNT